MKNMSNYVSITDSDLADFQKITKLCRHGNRNLPVNSDSIGGCISAILKTVRSNIKKSMPKNKMYLLVSALKAFISSPSRNSHRENLLDEIVDTFACYGFSVRTL